MDPLDAITESLFDYAGMFPPAALSFDAALREAAAHRDTLRRPALVATQMVARPGDLDRFTDEHMERAGWPTGAPCTIALVGFPLHVAEQAARTVVSFNREHHAKDRPCRIVSLEPTLEKDPLEHLEETRQILSTLREALGGSVRVYLEPRWRDPTWAKNLDPLIRLLTETTGDQDVALKVRCAGETAVSHETMARLIGHLARHSIPFKATQGLHHPIIEKDRWKNDWGFLNLAAAHWLHAEEDGPDHDETVRLLTEDDPRAYSFTDCLRWRGHEIDLPRLAGQKRRRPLAIGSCSIHEPDEDLIRLFH